MGPCSAPRAPRRPIAVVSAAMAVVLATPIAALAAWSQFQGSAVHGGISDGPTAPLRVAWTNTDIRLEGPNTTGGLSAPVVADDGTIVVVAPTAVLGFSGTDGSSTFSADRDFGPSSQPAIADGPDGPIVVFTEGFGPNPPTGTATPSPTPASDGSAGFDSHVNAVALGTGRPVWRSPVQLDEVVDVPVAVDDRAAYVADIGGAVTAVDLADGKVRWTVDLATPTASAVSVDDGEVLVSMLGERDAPSAVVALDAADGKEAWRSEGEGISNLVSTPVVADGTIFALDALGGIVAFSRDGGRQLWRTEVTNPRAGSQPFFVQGVSATAPVSADGGVFAVDVTGRVYALDAETGAVLWDQALNDPSPSPPILTDRHVLVAANSGRLYAVDRRTGHLAWRTRPEGDLLRGLADAGDVLVGVTGLDDAGLVAFAADPSGVPLDEPSPTQPDLGTLLTGFALGGVTAAAAAVLIARPLYRRLGPAPALPAGDAEDEDA